MRSQEKNDQKIIELENICTCFWKMGNNSIKAQK